MTDPDPDERPKSRWLYRLCVTLGITGTIIGVCTGLFFLGAEHARNTAAYMSSNGQMNQLIVGVHNQQMPPDSRLGPFHDDNGKLADLPSNLADRLSWRVTILPYMEQDGLFAMFILNEAWDSPNNSALSNTPLRIYSDPLDGTSKFTPYRVFYDNGALWDTDPVKRVQLSRVPDGLANTILAVESTERVRWAQFDEHRFDPNGPMPPLGHPQRNSFLMAMADGSVRVVKKTVSPQTLKALVTRAGGEAVTGDW